MNDVQLFIITPLLRFCGVISNGPWNDINEGSLSLNLKMKKFVDICSQKILNGEDSFKANDNSIESDSVRAGTMTGTSNKYSPYLLIGIDSLGKTIPKSVIFGASNFFKKLNIVQNFNCKALKNRKNENKNRK